VSVGSSTNSGPVIENEAAGDRGNDQSASKKRILQLCLTEKKNARPRHDARGHVRRTSGSSARVRDRDSTASRVQEAAEDRVHAIHLLLEPGDVHSGVTSHETISTRNPNALHAKRAAPIPPGQPQIASRQQRRRQWEWPR
jgi:hypothetical protein